MIAGGIIGDVKAHATAVADFAFVMHAGARMIRAPHDNKQLNIRVGVSMSPCTPLAHFAILVALTCCHDASLNRARDLIFFCAMHTAALPWMKLPPWSLTLGRARTFESGNRTRGVPRLHTHTTSVVRRWLCCMQLI
jgi:hypothetical protein